MKPGPDADDVGATELRCKELWCFCQTPLNPSGLLGTYSSTFSKSCNQSEELKLYFRAPELPSSRARTTWTMVCSGSGASGLDMNPKTQKDLAVYLLNRLISRHASDCEWISWFGRFALGFHDDTSTSWPSCTLEQESGTVP